MFCTLLGVSLAEVVISLELSWNHFVRPPLSPSHFDRDVIIYAAEIITKAEILPLNLAILFLDWYDLDRGVAQLSQVFSFLAEIIETLLAEALSLAEIIACRSAYAILLVQHTLS